MSIYLGSTKIADKSAVSITAVDSELSSNSTNPLTNQAIYNKLASLAPYIQSAAVMEMNGQSTVNTADLLTATGDFHTLDLDLSSNDKLTKLTAAGTSGSLANVSSVLVSSAAPFNHATGPQLDVSYAELNRTALVNLFNSMPHNVGYSVTGSPTITNGVMSGFSSSNFASINSNVNLADMNEFVLKLKINTSVTSQQFIMCIGTAQTTFMLRVIGSDIIATYGNSNIYFVSNYSLNTDYWIKFTNNGTIQKGFYSTDGIDYTLAQTETDSLSGSAGIYFGIPSWGGGDEVCFQNGQIDFNESYIKSSGKMWFMGQAAMTKTCSVVGCSGTADLTSSDKAIATDKGWSLTVA